MNWIKKMFGRKEKDHVPYKLDPVEVPNGVKIHAKFIGIQNNGQKVYKVNGVVFAGKDIIDVQRKYIRSQS